MQPSAKQMLQQIVVIIHLWEKKTIFLQILDIITNIGSSFSTTIGGIYKREVDTGRIM